MPADEALDRLASLIKAKRREAGLGVRASAEAAGVNAATMSRLERRLTTNLPDTSTLRKLTSWLGVSLENLLALSSPDPTGAPVPTVPEVVEVHLRADHKLDPEKAEALAKMFRILYQSAVREDPPP